MRFYFKTVSARIAVLGLVGVVILALLAVGLNALQNPPASISAGMQALIQNALQKQAKTEAAMDAYLRAGQFSLTSPLVIQNPYGFAPLTALIIFDTPEPVQIALRLAGKTPAAALAVTFDGYRTHHEVPVYGLYADALNQVTLTAKTEAGQSAETTLTIQTEALPTYLDHIEVLRADPQRISQGMNFTFQDHKPVYDSGGNVRWFSSAVTFQPFMRLANGHYLFTYPVADEPGHVLMEQDLLGKIYAVYSVPYGVHHDFSELPNGNILVTSDAPDTFSVMDILIELDRSSGRALRQIDLSDYLDASRPHEIDLKSDDWLHLNSVVYDPASEAVLLSGRSQAAVIKMRYPEMTIEWILGTHEGWSAELQPYLLTPQGTPFEWQWAQHHATILSETTIAGERFCDVLLFDNGNNRSFNPDAALPAAENYSRMVRYRINETRRTVEQVWAYGQERGSELFSTSRGSAYFLESGNYFGTWAEIVKNPAGQALMEQGDQDVISTRAIEVDPTNGAVVFEILMQNAVNYRTWRASLYSPNAADDAARAVKPNDTTVLQPLERAALALRPIKTGLSAASLWLKGAGLKLLKQAGFEAAP